MRFDGPTLAHAWLAVFAAAGTSKDDGVLHKTIAIEEHLTGVRLLATDRRILLTAWVPDLEHHYGSPPDVDQAPERVIVAADSDGRARNLLGYVIALATRDGGASEDYVPGQVPLDVTFDQRLPAGTHAGPDALEGLEPTYTVLSVPDVEKVYLEIIPAAYPEWRHIPAGHRQVRTAAIHLNPEVLERLAKIRKHAAGALAWRFGGHDRTALVEYVDSDPFVHGAVMPLRSGEDNDFADEPAAADDTPDPDPEPEPDDVADAGDGSELAAETLVKAAELVITTQFGSAAMLQRKLKLTPLGAAAAMTLLEAAGIVGPHTGEYSYGDARARDVLVRADDLDEAITRLEEAR